MMSNKLYVIGIGYKPLDKKAREIISRAGVILASSRLFEVFKAYEEFEAVKDKVKVINNVNETIEFIKKTSELPGFRAIVLLASGDPMFFGIGRRAVKEFGREIVEILPDLSSIQVAFAKIKEPWDDAFLMSLHGGPDPEKRRRLPYELNDIPSLLHRYDKIAILTDRENNPSEIARVLNRSEISNLESEIIMYVCERLGYDDERIIEGTPEEIASMTFREPNVVIIKRSAPSPRSSATVFGLEETEISHSRGLITKDEVRAVAIHRLRLPQKGIFWDIGAGSGSISIEVARLFPGLKVFAIEKNQEQVNHIRENKKIFNALNIEIIRGEAPDALIDLPAPDRVFIGGSGGRLEEIIDFMDTMSWSGIVVINATTIETANAALRLLMDRDYIVDGVQVNASRFKILANKTHLSALNPVFIIRGER
jgi:precorrin-6Y C5,15-methyltransferase (decarboxylating)